MLVVFAPSFLCVWKQMLWKNLRQIVLSRDFLHELLGCFDGESESVKLRIDFSESHLNFFKEFSQLQISYD